METLSTLPWLIGNSFVVVGFAITSTFLTSSSVSSVAGGTFSTPMTISLAEEDSFAGDVSVDSFSTVTSIFSSPSGDCASSAPTFKSSSSSILSTKFLFVLTLCLDETRSTFSTSLCVDLVGDFGLGVIFTTVIPISSVLTGVVTAAFPTLSFGFSFSPVFPLSRSASSSQPVSSFATFTTLILLGSSAVCSFSSSSSVTFCTTTTPSDFPLSSSCNFFSAPLVFCSCSTSTFTMKGVFSVETGVALIFVLVSCFFGVGVGSVGFDVCVGEVSFSTMM